MHGRHAILLAALACLAGCTEHEAVSPGIPESAPPSPVGTAFDAATAGKIEGRVVWKGPVPEVPPFKQYPKPETPPDERRVSLYPNPHRPLVASAGNGVADAVVFLRQVEPAKMRPWSHGPVTVEQRDRQIRVRQDGVTSRVGFVRRGDEVTLVNRDAEYHSLRARGAAFFTLPFAEPELPARRRLAQAGYVELTSGAGYVWMRAHLFVAEHPYFARTDAQGRFTLDQVPAGTYEVVCWLPSWVIARKERDPETGLPGRVVFAPPVEQSARADVAVGNSAAVRFAWSEAKVVGGAK